MEFNNNLEESSKSSSEETDRSSPLEQIIDHDGRIYECVFCKRGFTTAQALGGHMNIHRKDRANNNNKAKPNFIIPPSKVIDDEDEYNYSDLGYYSSIPSHLAIGRGSHHYYSTIVHHHHQHEASSYGTTLPSSHQVHYNNSEVLCEENYQRDYWRQRGNLSLYTNNLLCVHEKENNDKILKDKSDEEDGLDLELRLGHHHP